MNQFKVNRCFHISKRGYVLSGEIVTGEISAGQSIIIDSNTLLKITSVESVDISIKNRISEVGLLLRISSDKVISKLIGQTISIV